MGCGLGDLGYLFFLLVGGVGAQAGQHALGELVFPVGQLVIPSFVLPFVSEKLSGRMEDVITTCANTMNMVDSLGKSTIFIATRILLHKLFKPILVELFVFHMKVLVLLHIGLVFESELASGSVTVEVGGFLASEGALWTAAVLATSKPEKSFTLNGIIFSMIIKVHLDVGGRNVDFVTVA